MSLNTNINRNRSYVSAKETVGYILFDSSKTFNIDTYSTRFLLDVVKIDLGWQTIINAINGVWDIINDSFIGAIVDKTRTRYGKFRPYLIIFGLLGTLGTVFYWLTPMFFGNNPFDVNKFIYWLLLAMLREGTGTFRSISETGLIATVTPNPKERLGILTKSEFFSSFYEMIPEAALAVMIDLVNHGIVKSTLRTVYVSIGVVTTLISGLFALFCFLNTKERVQQTIERPSIKQGLRSIFDNKPVKIIMLSDLLTSLTINTGMDNYYIDVLGSLFIKNIVNIPTIPTYYFSFTYISWARKKFSTKQLWIFSLHFDNILSIIVFFLGSIGGKGTGGWFRSVKIMMPLLMAKEAIWQSTFGVKKTIPREIFNEAMDYCEWQNGYRTEGMTIAAKNMITKLVGNTNRAFKTLILKKIGYDISAGFGKQSDSTKYFLFVLTTLVPAITGLISVIPKFFYNINSEKREQMYEELTQRRVLAQKSFDENVEEG